MREGPELIPFTFNFPVYIYTGPSGLDDPLPVIRGFEVGGSDGVLLLPIFTDTDLLERFGNWGERFPQLSVNDLDGLLALLEDRPLEEFAQVAVDPWKGRARWKISREELSRQIRRKLP